MNLYKIKIKNRIHLQHIFIKWKPSIQHRQFIGNVYLEKEKKFKQFLRFSHNAIKMQSCMNVYIKRY